MESELIVDDNNVQYWYLSGTIVKGRDRIAGVNHRVGGPAIIWPDNSTFWYLHGRCHRDDGPAVHYTSGDSFTWWFDGRNYTFKEWCKVTNKTPEDILYLKLKYKIS